MTVRETCNATGINRRVIYRYLNRGLLHGEWTGSRWEIPAQEVMCWARWMWEAGRCLMFPPDYTAKFIRDFDLS